MALDRGVYVSRGFERTRPLAGTGALTLHVAGKLTPQVVSLLLPSARACGALGREQMLVALDDEDARAQLPLLRSPAGALAHRLVPDPGSPWSRIRMLLTTLRQIAGERELQALHLHGIHAGLAGLRLLPALAQPPHELTFAPHGSRALARPGPLRFLAWQLVRHGLRLQPQSPSRAMLRVDPAPEPTLHDSAVAPLFFELPRHEAKRPLLLSASLLGDRHVADAYARIAVLLNDSELGIGFNWIGPERDPPASALRAAGIGQFTQAASDAAARAQRLGSAWIYVAAAGESGFPLLVVEAMAAGVPCVVLDTPGHRAVLEDGRTGFVCHDLATMLQRIALLIDRPDLRASLGEAARSVALQRFSEPAVIRRWQAAVCDHPATPPGGRRASDLPLQRRQG